jgi:hypothetical protein
MTSELLVNIDGDSSGLQKAAKQSVASLGSVESASESVEKSLGKAEKATGKASGALIKGGTATRQAQTAMINLNRVVQDAPFGFIAIQNNIDPLVQSFLTLRNSTGSTGTAVKALLSSFAGPSGILAVVSLASAAFVAFGPKIEEAFNKGKAAAEEAKKSFEEAVSSVLKFESSASGIQFEGTRTATVDAALSSDARLRELKAIEDELQGGFFERRFKNIAATGSDILTALTQEIGKVPGALVDALAAQGDATQNRSNILNLVKAQIVEEEALNNELRKRVATIEAEAKIRRRAQELLPISVGSTDGLNISGGDAIIAPDLSATIQAEKEFIDAKLDRLAAGIKLEAQADRALEQLESETQALREKLEIEDQALLNQELQIDASQRLESAQSSLTESLTAGQFAFIEFGSAAATSLAEVVLGFEKIESVLDGLQSVLKNVVRDLVTAASKAAILSFLFPGASQAAGGFSGLFKGALGLRPFATGGIVTGPTPALIGEAGPEAVIPLNRLNGIMQARPLEVKALRVSGGDLLLTLQEVQSARGGGAISLK